MIEKRVLGYIERYHMIRAGDRVLIGLSGGADSAALFHILRKNCHLLGCTLLAVHVDHGLRGAEAARDRAFVERSCGQYEIPCRSVQMPVCRMAREGGLSLEEAGRKARQQVFAEMMKEWGCDKLALAHHKNDQAETMLHHLARGTGLSGLCGLSPTDGIRIRPLLCLERGEIEHYLKVEGFDHVEDSSNSEDHYTRNRIRHKILPELETQVNKKAVEHMAQTAQILRQADTYLRGQGRALLERYGTGALFLENGFFREDAVPAYYGLREFLDENFHAGRDIGRGHYERLLDWGRMPVGRVLELPHGIRAQKRYGGVSFYREDGEDAKETEGFSFTLRIPGEVRGPGFRLRCRVIPNNFCHVPQKTYTKWLNYDKIKNTVEVRTRRPGDRLAIDAHGGTKKLKSYLIDCKVPRQERSRVVLVAQGQEVLWVVGHRLSEAYKIQADTKEVLEIVYEGGSEYEGRGTRIDRRGGSG